MFAVLAAASVLIFGSGEITAQTKEQLANLDTGVKNPKQTEQVDKVEKKQTLEEVEKELGVKVDEKRRKYVQGVIGNTDNIARIRAKQLMKAILNTMQEPQKSACFTEMMNIVYNSVSGENTTTTLFEF
jgi:hypothetical protein